MFLLKQSDPIVQSQKVYTNHLEFHAHSRSQVLQVPNLLEQNVGKTSSSHSYSDLVFVHKPTTATRYKKTCTMAKNATLKGLYRNTMVSLLFYFQTFQRKGRYVCSLFIHYLRYRTQRGRSASLAHGSTWRTAPPKLWLFAVHKS